MSKSVDLSKFSNTWYSPGSLFLKSAWYFCNRIFLNTSVPYPNSFKSTLLKIFGAKVGKGTIVKPNVNIKYPWFLELGDYVWIGENCWIDNLGAVKIGSNVCLSQGAFIFCGNHDYKRETFDLIVKPIVIEDGVWVGAKSIVCPGVTLKTHSIISAGSVITKDTEAYTIYKSFDTQIVRKRDIN